MKITGLDTFVVGNPPPRFGGRYFIFVKLTASNGLTGIGEVYGASFMPQTMKVMVADVFEQHVEGMDPFRIEMLWRNVYGRGYSGRPDISLMARPVGAGDGVVGHQRQGGGQAGLRAARRQGA